MNRFLDSAGRTDERQTPSGSIARYRRPAMRREGQMPVTPPPASSQTVRQKTAADSALLKDTVKHGEL